MEEKKTVDPGLQEALMGIWDSLTDGQKERAKACESPDQLMQLAAEAGIELPDEMLDAAAGGYIYRTYQDKLDPRKDRYDVIRDSNGEVLDRDLGVNAAEKQAVALGQSNTAIETDYLEELRGRGRSAC